MKPIEFAVEDLIRKYLYDNNIFPYNVIFTSIAGSGTDVKYLSITLFADLELNCLLDLLDYKYLCNKGSYVIIRESSTLVIVGSEVCEIIKKAENGK